MHNIGRLFKPVTVLLAFAGRVMKFIAKILRSAGGGLRRIIEKIVSIIELFTVGLAAAALGAAVGWVISLPVVGLVLINGVAPYFASLGYEPITDLLAGGASLGSIATAIIIVNREDWSRSAKAGCMVFALAFSIHVLPDKDSGHRINACPSDKSIVQNEINIPLDNYEIAPRLKAPAGYVYLIHDSDHSKLYNFGFTTDISTRLVRINEQMPGDVTIVAILQVEFAAEYERRLRRNYSAKDDSNEWFELTHEQVREICRL